MAGAHPTASIATTIGVACATLLVMGGILAGPAVLDCSADQRGFGACLRDHMAGSGLVSPEDEQINRPPLVSEVPAEPEMAVSEEALVSVEPAKPTGWIDAQATELASEPSAAVALKAPGGTIDVAARPPAADGAAVAATLASPKGEMRAGGANIEPTAPAQSALAPQLGAVATTGSIGALPLPWAAELIGRPPPAFEEPLVEAAVEVPAPPVAEPEAAPAAAAPPPQVVRFDPQYPNVLVLPAPAKGEDSSFRTLQLN